MALEFLAAVCPNCGGNLRLPADLKVAQCSYCGGEVLIHDPNPPPPPPPLSGWLTLADLVLHSNSELAYAYYLKVLEAEPDNLRALLGKSLAAGWLSTAENPRFLELITDLDQLWQILPSNEKILLCQKLGAEFLALCQAQYQKLQQKKPLYSFIFINYCFLLLDLVNFTLQLRKIGPAVNLDQLADSESSSDLFNLFNPKFSQQPFPTLALARHGLQICQDLLLGEKKLSPAEQQKAQRRAATYSQIIRTFEPHFRSELEKKALWRNLNLLGAGLILVIASFFMQTGDISFGGWFLTAFLLFGYLTLVKIVPPTVFGVVTGVLVGMAVVVGQVLLIFLGGGRKS